MTLVVQAAGEELEGIFVVLVIPAVEQVEVTVSRHIQHAVHIIIHRPRALLIMRQHTSGQGAEHRVVGDRYIPTACEINLGVQFFVQHQVDGNRFLRLRLEVLDVDLSGDSLVAVDDR